MRADDISLAYDSTSPADKLPPLQLARSSFLASKRIAHSSTAKRNQFLRLLADLLSQYSAQDELIAANRSDVQSAYASGLSPSMIDRLSINHARISGLIEMIRRVRTLADPVGSIDGLKLCASGIRVGKMKVPLGVVLMIYESRPSATLESACLCIKSANAVILKGGKEAAETNGVLVSLIKRALSDADLPDQAVMFIERQEHEYLYELLRLKDFISVVIPRGGEGLIESIMERSRIPVLCHAKGVCHIYVCSDADLDSALNIIINSKVQRAGVCNAAECILVDESIATKFIPTLVSLLNSHGVLVRACNKSMTHLKGEAPDKVQRAASGDFGREFLSLECALKVVSDMDEALSFIETHGSRHTESILTGSYEKSHRFLREVDASCVLVNASTRFNDGGQLGLGAEVGISTTKLHAYGPMGLDQLCIEKFVVFGNGDVRTE